jgi:hypothetical protein
MEEQQPREAPFVPQGKQDDGFGKGGGKAGLKPGTYNCMTRTGSEEAWEMVA